MYLNERTANGLNLMVQVNKNLFKIYASMLKMNHRPLSLTWRYFLLTIAMAILFIY